jgi:dynein light chain Tctex-type 1
MMDEDGIGGSGLREDQLVTLDEMETVIRESIDATIGQSAFQRSKINAWTSNIVEGCLKRLSTLSKPFKYVVTAALVQKSGGGMHIASTSLWDDKTDGKKTIMWENPTMHCIVTVYWLAI